MDKENAIIINGVKHTLVKDRTPQHNVCKNQCSLYGGVCGNLCLFFQEKLHGKRYGLMKHFEILRQE